MTEPTILKTRLRRARANHFSRRLMQESELSSNDLIYPIFVHNSGNEKIPIQTMPGIFRHSIPSLLDQVKQATELNIPAIALFPSIESGLKTKDGSEALNPDGLIPRAIQAIKSHYPAIGIIADVALDPYTSHGHDGLVDQSAKIINDKTVEVLVKQALVLAQAGADVIAPSDMMDGRVAAIRQKLEQSNYTDTLILSYAAKYASHLYGPFRDAVGSKVGQPNSSQKIAVDKKTYQMDFHNSDEAISEVSLDLAEGADWILIKPGLSYLDILYRVKKQFNKPTFSYQVSGEYAMLKFAEQNGAIDYENTLIELLTAFKRSGADGIFSYAALDAARILEKK